MVSLEKMMFFIPNRLFIQGKHMYVSFNIAVIPDDMQITSMNLHVLLPAGTPASTLYVHEMNQGWDEKLMGEGYRPSVSASCREIQCPGGHEDIPVDISMLATKWKQNHIENHGVYIRLDNHAATAFSREQPPYLTLATL